MVFREFVTACRFAASPTNRSPDFVKATTEGVVRLPSEFSRTTGSPPSITAIQELVVPKSMPSTLAIEVLQKIKIQNLMSSGGAMQCRLNVTKYLKAGCVKYRTFNERAFER